MKVLVVQSCPTLCKPMDCSLPDSSVHGIFQARMVCHSLLQEIFLTQGLNLGLRTAGRFFTIWATREAQYKFKLNQLYFNLKKIAKNKKRLVNQLKRFSK